MGNSIPGKVILSDGTFHHYKKDSTVAELMLEFPQQLVFELQKDFLNVKKMSPLPADKNLEKNKVYLMLPIKKGKPTSLTSEEAKRVLIRAKCFLKSKSFLSSSRLVPLFSSIYPTGCVNKGGGDDQEHEIKRKPNKMIQLEESRRNIFADIAMPDYLNRQVSGKGWKPSLEPIKEKSKKMKIRHWLLKNTAF
ncbi:hypothetical protein Leryth_011207 [Lithospermum erythrorhizon]|uniref:Uncharacterized protein n=1 Tax=Lithospermum erythrorhizon TaxID=34254 RepID=A0AAV3RNC7_LITER|nr:hypothetical protein Leryth_011207 [Lithospermum erythrorhizon]